VRITRLLIFAKLPRSGEVKTRLQPLLGVEGCLTLHYCLIDHALELASQWRHGPVELWLSDQPSQSDINSPELEHILSLSSVEHHYQQGKDLGERMQFALHNSLVQGDRAILIGSDCPRQRIEHLDAAVSQLESGQDIVLQPAEDGGFVLIGSNSAVPNLSGKISWGGSRVLQQVEVELQKQRLSYGKIETISDLDDEKDFLLLQEDDSNFLGKFYKILRQQKKVLTP